MGRSQFSLITLFTIFVCAGSVLGEEARPQTNDSKAVALFDKQIKPVLVEHCYECHSKSAEDIGGGVELDSSAGMIRGGDSGPVVIPHDVEKSVLIHMLRHEADVSPMPPDNKLGDEVISAFEAWIRLGAPDSREMAGPTAREERIEAGKRHWSFQPPRSVEPPPVRQSDWPQGAIDQFVLARMEAAELRPRC